MFSQAEKDGIFATQIISNEITNDNNLIKLLFENIVSVILLNDIFIYLADSNGDIIFEHSTNDITDSTKLREDIKSGSGDTNIESIVSDVSIDNCLYRLFISSYSQDKNILQEIIEKLEISLMNLSAHYSKISKSFSHLLNCLDSVNEGISACDTNCRVTYINQAACDMVYSTKEEVLNQDLNTFISNSILVKAVKTKKAVLDVEYIIELKNNIIQLMNSAYPVFDGQNNLLGAVDIYKRKTQSIKIASDLMGHTANYDFNYFIGESKNFKDTIEIAKKFSKSEKNVLIIGDSGTGKELLAQSIHNHSPRINGPFVAINCASYPRDLFESELFGYEEGAFTGAKRGGKIGKFELANGGTIFLDEIGELHIHLQAKLLRIIETRSLSRIGSNKKVDIDIRIIAATNRNLEEMIQKGKFREDLYYRLRVLYLRLPSLKERGDDVLVLSNYFIEKCAKDSMKGIRGFDDEATKLVLNYNWPGNIRELENIISLSLFYCEGDYITKDNLVKAGLCVAEDCGETKSSDKKVLSQVTKELILKTLNENNGNKKKTAEQLCISRNTVYRKLKSMD